MPTKRKPIPEKSKFLGRLTVLQRLNAYEYGVELWVMRSGLNRNNWDFRNVEEYYKTFVGCPILCAYVGRKVGDGHNMRVVRDPKNGEETFTFMDATAERIVGTLSDDIKDFTLEERDGHTWIKAKGRLFAFYAPELVEKIVQTGSMDVSAETEAKESHMDGKVEVITKWAGLGVTILGDDVDPAIPGAHIAKLAAMQEEFKELKMRAAQYRENPEGTKKNTKKAQKKGAKAIMNKQAIARLAPKFAGYQIVGLSEDEMHAVLVNNAGETFGYTFDTADNGEVLLSRMKPVAPVITFAMEEGVEVQADLADIISPVVCAAKGEAGDIETLRNQLNEANKVIEGLRSSEHARRVDVVRNSVEAEMNRIMSAYPEVTEAMEATKTEILTNAEQFAGLEEEGKFCGDTRACGLLRSKAMELSLEAAEEAARNAKPTFAWDTMSEHKPESGTIEDMLDFITK